MNFVCYQCGGKFKSLWSDKEAMEEYKRVFGEQAGIFVVLCDGCYEGKMNETKNIA